MTGFTRRGVIAGGLSALAGSGAAGVAMRAAFAQPAEASAEAPVAIQIAAKPIEGFEIRDPQRRKFGALTFRGGLELTSDYRGFGGLSGFRVAADGQRFLALSDLGRWLRGRITYSGSRPTGIVEAEMAPILGPDGRTLRSRRWQDTESLAEDGGTVWVGIERVHRILRFDFGRNGFAARGQPIKAPDSFAKLPHNAGIEALVAVPKSAGGPLGGHLIAVSEKALDDAGNIFGYVLGGRNEAVFTVRRRDDFDITDAALAGDRLLILERYYARLRGIAMRIRSIPLDAIRAGAMLDGEVLIEADFAYQIDNMEALSAHRTNTGTVLTIVSDDNFSKLQRTLLLQFTLDD